MEKKVKEVVETEKSFDVKFEGIGQADEQVMKSDIEKHGADALVAEYQDEPWFKDSGLEGKIRGVQSEGEPSLLQSMASSLGQGEGQTEEDGLTSERGEGNEVGKAKKKK